MLSSFSVKTCSVKRKNLLLVWHCTFCTHYNLSWIISNSHWTLYKNNFFGQSQGLCEKGMVFTYIVNTHTHIHERERSYTYICIHLSPSGCKESFNSCYIMVHLPRVLQNGSIITSHVCSLLNYLSLFPGGKRREGRQLIQCKWKAFEAPYGEDVITVRQLIT